MPYTNIESCLLDLEKNGQLLRIKEEIDPYLEAAAIQLRVFENSGKAVLFENIKGCKYRAASNIFGTLQRCEFIFRDTLPQIKELMSLRKDPIQAIKHPFKNLRYGLAAINALPKKKAPSINNFDEIKISDLPQIQHWEKDGGAFITLPQVYSEDLNHLGIMHANLGMYRIQLSGNDYSQDKEIGLHYQIHRGIGVHQ
ncbi:MAG TPA: UbiD family decarboxylase, partial [Arachidicoccus sp.]